MKADFYLFARYIYADIAVVHLKLLSDHTPSPYLIVPDRVWTRCVSLSLAPYEYVVFCILNILLCGSEILFDILEKGTVAVYICAVSTPKFCRGFCFLHPKYSSSLLRIHGFEFLVPTFHFFFVPFEDPRGRKEQTMVNVFPSFED